MLPIMPHSPSNDSGTVILRVNIVETKDGIQKRAAPEMVMLSTDASTIEQFCEELRKQYGHVPETLKIKAWQADGMTVIHDNVEWLSAQLAVGMYEWMDGSLKVLVEV